MVLQRLQSLYLLIAAILLGIFAFSTPVSVSTATAVTPITAIGACCCNCASANYVLLVLIALTAILAFITIFKYKNLKLQLQLCSVCMLLTLVIGLVIGILAYQAIPEGNWECSVEWSSLLLVGSFVLLWMARRGVAHDKKVIHDSESFR
ncbi:MAG: DUF4293 family protein [Sodaliphilus sp.]